MVEAQGLNVTLKTLIAVLGTVIILSGLGCEDRFKIAPNPCPPEPFDAEGWHSGSSTRRNAMGRDLVNRGALLGKRREDVVQQLGTPTEAYDSKNRDDRPIKVAIWSLGEQSDGSIGWNYFILLRTDFDANNVCIAVTLYDKD